MSEKPQKIQITDDYLEKFTQPLWDKLDLESCIALSAIEGEQNGFQFAIVDMRHDAYGPLSGDGRTSITTFIVISIDEGKARRQATLRPQGYEVSVDKDYVYLAKASHQVRPKEWKHLIQLAIQVAQTVNDFSASMNHQPTSERTYRPVGVGAAIHAFWGIGFFIMSLLMFYVGFGILFGWIDYRTGCPNIGNTLTCTTVFSHKEALKTGALTICCGIFCIFGALYYRKRVLKRTM